MIKANDPSLKSWIEVDTNSDFPIQNIPFGIFKDKSGNKKMASIIGDQIIDLDALAKLGYFKGIGFNKTVFRKDFINDFMELGKTKTGAIRNRISQVLNIDNNEFCGKKDAGKFLIDWNEVEMCLPVKIGDYTDFYSSIEHATNVGKMFRDPENALMPNWKHIPVGYHGRSSSIVVSGTPIKRPVGQQIPKGATQPVFGPCRLLDFELEMAFVIGKSTNLGDRVSTKDADDYIFGLTVFNDWSARDIQKWEYVPLGPFLGKNFASTLSPWIVTLEALQPFKVDGPKQEPSVLPYLKYTGMKNIDVKLQVAIKPPNTEETVVSNSNFKYMYWNMNQQLAHHTVNGCNLKVGDLYASGTISGKTPSSYGSMLEISWQGTKSIKMIDGTERKFINDGDEVIMRGFCEKDGLRIGFGEANGIILPADLF